MFTASQLKQFFSNGSKNILIHILSGYRKNIPFGWV